MYNLCLIIPISEVFAGLLLLLLFLLVRIHGALFLFIHGYLWLYAAHCTWKTTCRSNLRSRMNVPSSRENVCLHLPVAWGPFSQIQGFEVACTAKHCESWLQIQYTGLVTSGPPFPWGCRALGSLLSWRGSPIRLPFWFLPPLFHKAVKTKVQIVGISWCPWFKSDFHALLISLGSCFSFNKVLL